MHSSLTVRTTMTHTEQWWHNIQDNRVKLFNQKLLRKHRKNESYWNRL